MCIWYLHLEWSKYQINADKIFVLANFWKSKIYEKIFVDWNSKSRDIC